VKASARLAVGASENPDAIADITAGYTKTIPGFFNTLTVFFMKDGKFNLEKARISVRRQKAKNF